jgi:hypothetical protein
MQPYSLKTQFMSRYDLEHFNPPANAVLISISDNEDDKAQVNKALWSDVSFHTFIDAGYDEETISYGLDYDRVFSDYITPEKANALRADIERMLSTKPALFVINCQAGRSRSAAVAKYLHERYSAEISQDTPDANQTVLRLLRSDPRLLASIQAARSGELDAQSNVEEREKPRNLISRLLEFIGVDTRNG